MPARNEDLHGMAPDKSEVALILLDVINDLAFEGAELLLPHALQAAPRIAALKRRTDELGIPAVYVNDNFGRWRSDLRTLIDHCLQDGCPGKPIVEQLLPAPEDYFILKPKHSGFFSTTLDVLLSYLGARTLIITGFAGDICVLFTANDAYMRDFHLAIPRDCVASNCTQSNERAVRQMHEVLKANVAPSTELDLRALLGRSASLPACPMEAPTSEPESPAAAS